MLENSLLAGHYQIVKPLGGGGFGQTFLAQDLHLPGHPLCVVKQLKPQVKDPATLEVAKRLFNQEAETLYRLNHPQIPRLLAHFEQDQEFYLVQEYIEGQPLDQEIREGQKKSEADVISLLQDLLNVLEFVHQQNVIHRDIKPANLIRRQSDNKIVLIDFGAVKEVSATAVQSNGNTTLTVAVGSPGYMPSEQKSFKPHFSSDIYAVGMLCLQALTGLPPKQLLNESLDEYSCKLVEKYLRIDPKLAALIDRMGCYDYRHRYQNATEALTDLQKVLENQQPVTFDTTTAVSSPTSQAATTETPTATTKPPVSLSPPEGQVPLSSPLYVERPPIESDCYEAITKPAALIRIKAPRQMGKTSLMSRILDHAQQQGYATVGLNFQSADAEFLTNLDLFLQWFCASIAEELDIDDNLQKYWKGVLGSKSKCTKYFQRYLLKEITQPLTLGLDEVDQIFQYPEIATDFFGLLRAWHEKGKNDETWQKLRLVIVHSKEVYIPLNINQSPFNVGLPIELPELNKIQAKELVKLHGLDWTDKQLQALMSMVGGHPYLMRVALYQIAKGRMTLEEILQAAPTEEGIFGDHLRRHLLNLQDNPELLKAMQQVIDSKTPVEIPTAEAFKLRSMGLVKFEGNALVPLCQLYRDYLRVGMAKV